MHPQHSYTNTSTSDDIPYKYSQIEPESNNSDKAHVIAIIITFVVVILSMPSVRSLVWKILRIPLESVRILSKTYEESENEIDNSIRDDDETEGFAQELTQPRPTLSIFSRVWALLADRFYYFIHILTSIRVLFGDRAVDVGDNNDGAWPHSKGDVPQANISKQRIQNIALPLENKHIHVPKQINEAKTELTISFDVNSLEPTFLNEEDYPDDWIEYDPISGTLVKRKEKKANEHPAVEKTAISTSSEISTRNSTGVPIDDSVNMGEDS